MKKKIWILIAIVAVLAILFVLISVRKKEDDGTQQKNSFVATVIEINDSSVLVEPVEGEDELRSSDQILFSINNLEDIGADIGSVVEISYTGGIAETYPAQIQATGWRISNTLGTLQKSQAFGVYRGVVG